MVTTEYGRLEFAADGGYWVAEAGCSKGSAVRHFIRLAAPSTGNGG